MEYLLTPILKPEAEQADVVLLRMCYSPHLLILVAASYAFPGLPLSTVMGICPSRCSPGFLSYAIVGGKYFIPGKCYEVDTSSLRSQEVRLSEAYQVKLIVESSVAVRDRFVVPCSIKCATVRSEQSRPLLVIVQKLRS